MPSARISFLLFPQEAAELEEDEETHRVSDEREHDSPSDYYRQPVFLHWPKCPYIPHLLHFVRIATGTVLVLISEVCVIITRVLQQFTSLA